MKLYLYPSDDVDVYDPLKYSDDMKSNSLTTSMGKVSANMIEPSFGSATIIREQAVSYKGAIPKGKWNNVTNEFVIQGRVNVSCYIYAGIYTGSRRMLGDENPRFLANET